MTDLLSRRPDTAPEDAAGSGPPGSEPAPPSRPSAPRPFRPRELSRGDMGLMAASALSSFCVVWLLFTQLTLLSGPFAFLLCWAIGFLALYWVVNLQLHGRLVATDRLASAVIVVGALVMLTPLVLISAFLIVKGWHLISLHVLTHDDVGVGPLAPPGRAGIQQAIVGTLEQAGIAAALGIPLGILTAVFINEVGGRFARVVRVIVTAMSGVPSIVAGIFIYSVWIKGFGEGYSGFAGSLALFVMLLPSVTRGTEEVLKVVSDDLRQASLALGTHEWRTVWSVVLPTARSGVITAALMGVARVVGETAPLLVTIFGNQATNWNPFHGAQSALPLTVYTEIHLPLKSAAALAFTAALVLYLLVFILFLAARLLGGVRLSGGLHYIRQRRRSKAQKEMDLAAMEGVRGGSQYL